MALIEQPIQDLVSEGWFPDPEELHKMRYFDGNTWTEHVIHYGPAPCERCAPGRSGDFVA